MKLETSYIKLKIILFLSIFFIVSCGGSSDSDSKGDSTPPTITSTYPLDSATGIPKNSIIYANFNEPINTVTITNVSFTVNNGSNISGTLLYNTAENKAILQPSSELGDSTTYTATITIDITDLAGNHMANEKTWTFTTGTTSETKNCTVTWTANREKAVNTTGGGYTIYYCMSSGFNIGDPGVASINVQYTSGPSTPTTKSVSLPSGSGTWYFKIKAYSALNSGSFSELSSQQSVSIPE